MSLTFGQIDKILKSQANPGTSGGGHGAGVKIVGIADLPTRFGHFQVVGFSNTQDVQEHIAIMHGNAMGRENVVTRVHSECLTGEVLGSLRCDCREQLEGALRAIAAHDCGLVLYLRQEGRGIGLLNKVRAYALQDRGLDTVEANLALGFRDDERDYSIAAQMLTTMGIKSIRLLTNNPKKVEELTRHGVRITGRQPHIMPPNEFNRFYLETKRDKSGHLLDGLGRTRQLEPGESFQVDSSVA